MAVSSSTALLRASDDNERPAAPMATTTVKVDGMTCGACTSAVEGAFKGVDGAGNVSVSLMMGRAVVHHDPITLSAEKVAEMIEDSGFDAAVLSTDTPSAKQASGRGEGPSFSTTTLAVEDDVRILYVCC